MLVEYILPFTLGMLLVFTVGLILRAIGRNLRQGSLFRRSLARQMSSLRLSNMLKALGIDQHEYLHTVPVVEIEDQMRKCKNCSTYKTCDAQLQQSQTPENLDFCPNAQALKVYSQRAKKAVKD